MMFPTKERIEEVEAKLLPCPQVEMPLKHQFAPGVYLRTIFMPAGTFVIGHEHKTEHFNIVLQGRAKVLIDGVVTEIKAPDVFVSGVGVRKVLYIVEEMIWATIHPLAGLEACGQDIAKLEAALCVKSHSFISHQEAQQLRGEL